MKYSLHPFCTCGSLNTDKHYFSCDLMYRSNSFPRKRKRFFFLYPMKVVKR